MWHLSYKSVTHVPACPGKCQLAALLHVLCVCAPVRCTAARVCPCAQTLPQNRDVFMSCANGELALHKYIYPAQRSVQVCVRCSRHEPPRRQMITGVKPHAAHHGTTAQHSTAQHSTPTAWHLSACRPAEVGVRGFPCSKLPPSCHKIDWFCAYPFLIAIQNCFQ